MLDFFQYICSVLMFWNIANITKFLIRTEYKLLKIKTMVFRDYMKSLPNQREETIIKIAELTGSTRFAVYKWMQGVAEPPLIKKKAIADFLGIDINELWPCKN